MMFQFQICIQSPSNKMVRIIEFQIGNKDPPEINSHFLLLSIKTRPEVYSWPHEKMEKKNPKKPTSTKQAGSIFEKYIKIIIQLGLDLKFSISRS